MMKAYADDTMIMNETEYQKRNTADNLIEKGNIIRININKNQIKYFLLLMKIQNLEAFYSN